ncbi:MAG: hypothetical protein HUK23_00090 [Sphaerochaetaceae bacterium]|nr:hypothetical protein [Sphaerochaetaceae bacterium]
MNKKWIVPDMCWPKRSSDGGKNISHEAISVLNTSDEDAFITVTLYYQDREPIVGKPVLCAARRSKHFRMNTVEWEGGAELPVGVGYSVVVESNIPVCVQYTRMDTTQCDETLMTTMAYPVE